MDLELTLNSWMVHLLLTLTTILAVYFYYRTKKAHRYWSKKGVAFKKPVPFIGSMVKFVAFRQTFAKAFQEVYNLYPEEKVVGIYQFNKPIAVIRDPNIIKNILIKDFGNFQSRGLESSIQIDPLGEHLFNLDGSRWRNLRIKLSPTFTSGKMKMMFHLVVKCGESLAQSLKVHADQENEVVMKVFLENFTTDSIGSCAFGLEFGATKEEDSKFRQVGQKLFKPTLFSGIRRILRSVFPSLLRVFNIQIRPKEVTEFFINLVKDTMKLREENGIVRNDFFQLLIQLRKKQHIEEEVTPNGDLKEKVYVNGISESNGIPKPTKDIEFTDSLLTAQAFVFFAAGFETSSTAMNYLLYELALNPQIQDKLRNEVIKTFEENNGEITYEALQDMKYLDMAVSETLRKYPPVPFLIRKSLNTYKFPGTDIEIDKHVDVHIPVYGLQMDPKHFPNPDRFDPERFSEANVGKQTKFTYLPFGDGPRHCIGLRFGLLQSKIGIVQLLKHYKFEVCSKTQIPIVLDPKSVILVPKPAITLKISNV